MKSNKYEPRPCEICGAMFKPGRIDQRTCGSPECKHERLRRSQTKWREKNYAHVIEANRRAMAKKRKEREQEKRPPKKDTIVAIGYADRQRAETLKLAGRVNTEL